MFGYVRPYRPSLTHRDYEFYRAVYCGLCRSLKSKTGRLSTLALNYDLVFLALVRLTVGEDHICIAPCRCIAHPFRCRRMAMENPATDYAARVLAVLAYYQVLDDLHDERGTGRLRARFVLPVLRRAARRADLPEMEEGIRTALKRLSDAENDRISSVDIPAGIFGELLGDVFAYDAPAEYRVVLRRLGAAVGRFIYAADAAEDYERDRRKGSYNPYVLAGGAWDAERKSSVRDALLCTLAEGEDALLALPRQEATGLHRILHNIYYEGLPHRLDFLLPAPEHPQTYDGVLP